MTSPTRRRSLGCATEMSASRSAPARRWRVSASSHPRTSQTRWPTCSMHVLSTDELAARTERAVSAATAAGEESRPARIAAARPLRRVLRDRPSCARPVVVRVPTVLPPSYSTDPEMQTAQQRSELDVAGWLADRGHPVVPPSPLVPREPVRRDGFSMTFWQFVDEIPGAERDTLAPHRADRTPARRTA